MTCGERFPHNQPVNHDHLPPNTMSNNNTHQYLAITREDAHSDDCIRVFDTEQEARADLAGFLADLYNALWTADQQYEILSDCSDWDGTWESLIGHGDAVEEGARADLEIIRIRADEAPAELVPTPAVANAQPDAGRLEGIRAAQHADLCALRTRIALFSQECEEKEHTDTDEVWQIFNLLLHRLPVGPEPAPSDLTQVFEDTEELMTVAVIDSDQAVRASWMLGKDCGEGLDSTGRFDVVEPHTLPPMMREWLRGFITPEPAKPLALDGEASNVVPAGSGFGDEEFCDDCGKIVPAGSGFAFASLPADVASANKGESAFLCSPCATEVSDPIALAASILAENDLPERVGGGEGPELGEHPLDAPTCAGSADGIDDGEGNGLPPLTIDGEQVQELHLLLCNAIDLQLSGIAALKSDHDDASGFIEMIEQHMGGA